MLRAPNQGVPVRPEQVPLAISNELDIVIVIAEISRIWSKVSEKENLVGFTEGEDD